MSEARGCMLECKGGLQHGSFKGKPGARQLVTAPSGLLLSGPPGQKQGRT